jgi:hypothetical protein
MNTNTATITVNEIPTGRYIGVQFFLVRKDAKVIGLIAKKDDSADWFISRQESPKFSQSRGFNMRVDSKEAAVEWAINLHNTHESLTKSVADAITGKGPTTLLGGKVQVIKAEVPKPAKEDIKLPYTEKLTLDCTLDAFIAIDRLDETFIGTRNYMGRASFWSHEYRHIMRDCTNEQRVKIHHLWMGNNLKLDDVSDLHAQIMNEVYAAK